MRIVFSTEPATGLLNHLSVVRELAARGNQVVVAVHGELDSPVLERLSVESPGLVVERAADPSPGPTGRWVALASDVRSSLDFLAFLDERFNETYRRRSRRRAPRPVLVASALLRIPAARALARRLLELVDGAIPADPVLERYLLERRPDVVLFTPYVGLRTSQVHLMRAAKALGLRTAICVKSWDNLTSKSALRPLPDRVFVWNETQRDEARELHGVDPRTVVVTGAQCFDHFLSVQPRPRDEFAARVGFDPAEPLILYTLCAPWTGQRELPFVVRWLTALRESRDDLLERAAVLVRPHPKRPDDVTNEDLRTFGRVVVWPEHGAVPVEGEERQDYLDSLAHSAAVVGLNTTAMVEAALYERPVLTVLDPEYRLLQHGTLHFRYLLEAGDGLLEVAGSLDEHVRQLGAALRDPVPGAERARAFASAFLRPYGPDVPATPVFADEVERLGREPPYMPAALPVRLRAVRMLLEPLARRAVRHPL